MSSPGPPQSAQVVGVHARTCWRAGDATNAHCGQRRQRQVRGVPCSKLPVLVAADAVHGQVVVDETRVMSSKSQRIHRPLARDLDEHWSGVELGADLAVAELTIPADAWRASESMTPRVGANQAQVRVRMPA